jgi:hypothetical protein
MAKDRDALMHPALRARQMQISQATADAIRLLANTAAALRRTAKAAGAFPEAAQIASAVESVLRGVSASLRRWNGGEVPTSMEIEAVGVTVWVAHAALIVARELCACAAVGPP